MRKRVDIYTDGACSGNPGAGGWCAILIYNNHEKIISGFENFTTNNRMELLSVVKGLKELKESCYVSIYSDSSYVTNAFILGWINYWRSHEWYTKSRNEVKNRDLWEDLIEESEKHIVNIIKVKGHSDNIYNNRCDEIAKFEIKKNNL
ncbi:MAG: ribonuclease HI [Clostridia bacterium]|jgi:ribonuclease HI